MYNSRCISSGIIPDISKKPNITKKFVSVYVCAYAHPLFLPGKLK